MQSSLGPEAYLDLKHHAVTSVGKHHSPQAIEDAHDFGCLAANQGIADACGGTFCHGRHPANGGVGDGHEGCQEGHQEQGVEVGQLQQRHTQASAECCARGFNTAIMLPNNVYLSHCSCSRM